MTLFKHPLSVKCVELGRAARLANDLRKVALPYMRELWRQFEDTVNLAMLDDGQICYLEVLEAPQRIKFVASPGDRDPVHCTALGKVMMANLPGHEVRKILDDRGMPRFTASTITTVARFEEELASIRRQGYAINEGEMVEASRCVAVAVVGGKSRIIAGISVSGVATRITRERTPEVSQALLRCSREIGRQLE
jgi:IclR family acetate operon transcriptional repressor